MSAEVLTNLEAVGDLIGALSGISSGIDEDAYIEGLIHSAHGKAATVFDVAAAATAKTGNISHVYEFGVSGVTPGQPRFVDPTKPEARLYIHELIGHGGTQDIMFAFRPATQPNPEPTPESTGVESKYLDMLSGRKYYFYNKAMVMEDGRSVEIQPKHGDFLFVPFYGRPPRDDRNGRGYMMWDAVRHGPIHATPGARSKGSFGKFWVSWWESAGSDIILSEMEKSVTTDLEIAVKEALERAAAAEMKSALSTKVSVAAEAAKALFNKVFAAKTAKRMEKKTR